MIEKGRFIFVQLGVREGFSRVTDIYAVPQQDQQVSTCLKRKYSQDQEKTTEMNAELESPSEARRWSQLKIWFEVITGMS